MIEIITESWLLQGWHQSPSGRWYHPNVCKGMAGHLPEYCDKCGRLYLNRLYKTKGKKGGSGKRFCSQSCARKANIRTQDLSHLKPFERKKGERPHNYIGRTSHSHGYIVVSGNKQVHLEHRVLMQQYLGRPLNADEVVHHINHDKMDNRITNLEVLSRSAHALKHWKEGSYDYRNAPSY